MIQGVPFNFEQTLYIANRQQNMRTEILEACRAMSLAISRRILTSEARLQFQRNQYEICGG